MGVIKGFFNTLANPRLFFLLAVAALILMVWKREKIARTASATACSASWVCSSCSAPSMPISS
jgi:hypothetical protein